VEALKNKTCFERVVLSLSERLWRTFEAVVGFVDKYGAIILPLIFIYRFSCFIVGIKALSL